MNGRLHGQLSGSNTKSVGGIDAPVLRSRRQSASESSAIAAIISVAARLLLWYSVITAIFRCPSSSQDLTDNSPRICKPYFQIRTSIAPHVEPHFNAYLKPYLDQAQPHVDRFNKKVCAPASSFSKQQYDLFAAPRVAKLQAYTEDAWSRTVKPRIELRRKWVSEQYHDKLSPYVDQITGVTTPYIFRAKEEMVDIYKSALVPSYKFSLPYVEYAYAQTRQIAVEVILPHLLRAEQAAVAIWNRKIWPQFFVLYSENVEPQMHKISERLGRYKDSKKLGIAVKEKYESATTSNQVKKPTAVVSSSPSAVVATGTSTTVSEKEKEADTREKIESDLKIWQEKFAKAAGKGADDLQNRVKEITDRQRDSQARVVGQAYVTQLENTASDAVQHLKKVINRAVKDLPEEANQAAEDAAKDLILSEIRSAGQAVRERAQAIRTWKRRYDNDTLSLVTAALQSTYNVIDNIRDLGLQEIGMRWAWMEGVTYQDWTKYHDLKSTFDEWRNGVKQVALGHKGLKAAQDEGDVVQESGMKAAEKAAKELAALKEASRWKINTRDFTDNFVQATVAEQVAQKIISAAESIPESIADPPSVISDAVFGSSQDTVGGESSKVSEIYDSVLSAASTKAGETSAVVIGTPPPASNVFGGVMAASVPTETHIVLENEFVDDTSSYADQIRNILLAAGDKASDLTDAVSSALITPPETQGAVGTVTSLVSAQYASALSAASSAMYGTTPGAVESISSAASEKFAQAVTAASYAIYGTPAPALASLSAQVSARFDVAKSMALQQYSKASAAIAGTPQPAHEVAMSSIEAAYSDSLSAASAKLQLALGLTASVASLWARPTLGVYDSISSAASARLEEGLREASAKYERAKTALGAQSTPAPQKYLVEAQKQYYQGVGLAHDRYSQFLAAASGVVYGTPTPVYQSWIAAAQSQYTVAASLASVQYHNVLNSASSVVGKTSKSPAQSVLDSASSQYNVALSAAAEALMAASSSASLAVYGTPTGKVESMASAASVNLMGTETPWTEAAASQASHNWEALVSKASEQIYGSPTPWHESAWSQAGGYAASASDVAGGYVAQASDAAASQYAVVQALINDLVVGKEPDFTESVMNRLSSAYYTGAAEYAASATSVVGDAYASASSVVVSVFTPPTNLESIMNVASEHLNAVVEAASIGMYGTQTGVLEKATSAAASVYGSVQSQASEVIYGTQSGYAEAAQSSLADVASSAQSAISVAIYGTPAGTLAAATSRAASVYSSVSSVAAEKLAAVGEVVQNSYGSVYSQLGDSFDGSYSAVSSAVYGPEEGAVESATNRIALALESARARLSSLAEDATGAAAEQLEAIKSNLGEMADSMGSMASSATASVKDEL